MVIYGTKGLILFVTAFPISIPAWANDGDKCNENQLENWNCANCTWLCCVQFHHIQSFKSFNSLVVDLSPK